MKMKAAYLAATALGLMLPLAPAFAQNPASTPAPAEDEILVTARKREESILKVPVTETVLPSVVIQRANITGLFGIANKTVGLKLGTAAVESGALVSIRGFGTNATDPGVDQSVSLNLDGLQLTEGMSYTVGTFDMQQVEVLKGPQALFFGKASPAGVISIRTNDPGDHFELIGRAAYEKNAHESRNELILSGPISDTLGVRIASLYDHFGGFFFNRATPDLASGALPLSHRLGRDNGFFIRGTALYKPSSAFTARLKLTYTDDKQRDGTIQQFSSCPEGTVNLVSFAPSAFAAGEDCKVDRNGALVGTSPAAFPGQDANDEGITTLHGGRPASRIKQKFGSLELTYTPVSTISITSVTGYYKLGVDVDYNCYNSGGAAPACMAEARLTRRDFTQELRANSDFNGPLNFSFGGFYQNGRIHDAKTLPGNINFFLPPLILEGDLTVHIKAYSLFGQVRYQVVPNVELAAGVRWTDERRSLDSVTYDLPFTPFHTAAGFGTPEYLTNPKLGSKNLSPEFTITYTPTDELTLFGSWKRAFKSGSYNLVTPTNPQGPVSLVDGRYVGVGADRSYGDEKIQGVELGLKSRLFDRQLSFNVTGYYYKASDLQVGTSQPAANGLPVLNTLNAASAKIYGVEADLNYRPETVSGLEIFGALNWNHARFTSFPNAPCLGGDTYAEGCNRSPGAVNDAAINGAFSAPNNLPPGVTLADLPAVLQGGTPFRYTAEDLAGYPLVRAPDWTATAGFHYQLPVGRDMRLGFGSDVQYSSKYLTLLGLAKLRPYFYQRAFAKINATVSLDGPDDAWELAFIGNNLTNKLVLNTTSGVSPQGGGFFVPAITGGPARNVAGLDESIGFVDRGRELWVRLTVKFGR